jgi:hypothetical protein
MRFLDGATRAGPGVRVVVQAYNGLSMAVEFVSFERPRVVAMSLIRGPWFLDRFAGSWRFLPGPESRTTEVIFRYVYEARPRWLRWLLNPVFGWVFRRDVRARLRGLKRGAEGGLLARRGAGEVPCGR